MAEADLIVTFHIGDHKHVANLTAMFSHSHEDRIEYAKVLSSNYAVWAEAKEEAKALLTRLKAKLDLLRAQKRLYWDEWYSESAMKPVVATLNARIESDKQVQAALEDVMNADFNHGQAKVVTETLWFQRSLITRDEET